MALRITVNGTPHELDVAPEESLLEVLRERCGVTSVKDGCSPQGQCGCCLALVDGRAVVTCALPAAKAEGKEVVTLEGLPEEERALIARSFAATAGLQCGYCTPGIALRATHLVAKDPCPSREAIAKGIDVHLCRCTGYTKVIDAIDLYARCKRGEAAAEPETRGGVGERLVRYQGEDLTLGTRDYVADMKREGLLHGAVRLSDHPRAKVLRIDTAKAKAHPGVVAVATAADVPGERWYGLILKDWPGFVAVGEEVRCVGDFLTAIAAVDERTAREAAALVEVEYEV
ncbi:MAG: 2Fe-2S iron-sulfur cluster binding domain-containing protein, partial [Myxococcales bacterium]|nr:2Fe-2S iron-sulfur cluster binding domain-containing protein [Myxococcales bacterium]